MEENKHVSPKKTNRTKFGLIGLLMIILLAFILNATVFGKKDITNAMKTDENSYLIQEENEYLVYMYDLNKCKTCKEFKDHLKEYKKQENGMPIYTVKTSVFSESVVVDELLLDPRYPTLIHVVNQRDHDRYVGTFPINELPKLGKANK